MTLIFIFCWTKQVQTKLMFSHAFPSIFVSFRIDNMDPRFWTWQMERGCCLLLWASCERLLVVLDLSHVDHSFWQMILIDARLVWKHSSFKEDMINMSHRHPTNITIWDVPKITLLPNYFPCTSLFQYLAQGDYSKCTNSYTVQTKKHVVSSCNAFLWSSFLRYAHSSDDCPCWSLKDCFKSCHFWEERDKLDLFGPFSFSIKYATNALSRLLTSMQCSDDENIFLQSTFALSFVIEKGYNTTLLCRWSEFESKYIKKKSKVSLDSWQRRASCGQNM